MTKARVTVYMTQDEKNKLQQESGKMTLTDYCYKLIQKGKENLKEFNKTAEQLVDETEKLVEHITENRKSVLIKTFITGYVFGTAVAAIIVKVL